MSLYDRLRRQAAGGRPVRVGLAGAGKFGSMFLAQVPKIPGVQVLGIVDLDPDAARANLQRVGWNPGRCAAGSLDIALNTGAVHIGEDFQALAAHPAIDVLIEATGNPMAAAAHCLEAFANGKPVINVTVEADAFIGPILARKAMEAGVIYSMAYGDQPALACDLVDWARTCGFKVMAAGRGHKWLPHYRESTPETVWDHWGLTAEQAEAGGLNPKMFNAFLDGSKPAIESAAIANACGLWAPSDGLTFPPGSIDDIPTLMRLKEDGGVLESAERVEVISSLRPDGEPIPYDIRKGVWVCLEADSEYIERCFEEYQVTTDPTGRYMSVYKRWHMIGLELGYSVASVALRGEATGMPRTFNADVVATAKRDLATGDVLDGEGGSTVYGKLLPAEYSVRDGNLPLGLSHGPKVIRPVAKDQCLTWDDVEADETGAAFQLRREMEAGL